MPRLRRPGGVEIHWDETGEGPLVLVSTLAYQPPEALDAVTRELSADHRVVRYHCRGSGQSTRSGPYDMDTDVADLAALAEEVGGGALALCMGDGGPRAVRVASARPDLVHTVVLSGDAPLGRRSERDTDALADSPAVLAALVSLLASDYRAGLRTMFESTGEDLGDEEIRRRIDACAAFCPQDTMVARLESWIHDESVELGRSIGDRLWIVYYGTNPWFLGGAAESRRDMPDAHLIQVTDGIINRPAENAEHIRRIVRQASAPLPRAHGAGGS